MWLWAEPLGGGFHPPFGSVLGVNPSSAIPPAGSTMSGAKKGVELLALYPLPNYTVNHCGPSLEVSDRGDLQVSMGKRSSGPSYINYIAVLFISNILKQFHSVNQHLVTFENAHQTSILAMTTTGDQDVSNWSDKF